MPKIQKLPPEIANKIAAGEVIERPASVVKELVENAIDAGATRITIDLEDAGKQLIRVSDNGSGMECDDLVLACAEHATSKLNAVDDLFYIDTMGFRGEALPSIASISHVRIVSRTTDNPEAWEITNHGGEQSEPKPASGAPGTVIEVANLFYNTPVRRKFLRQNSTELGRVIETIENIALAYPAIGFTLNNDHNAIFELPQKQARRERIVSFGGAKLSDALIEVNDFDEYASLTGFVGSPGQHRPNSKDLRLFVNRRFIRDRSLLQAVMLAYREFIPHGRYPVAYLFLELDPSEVDVNVHPTKIEVRFTQASRLFGKIKAAVQEAVLRSGQLPRLDLNDRRLEQVKALAGASQQEIHASLQQFRAPLPEARPGSSAEPDLELATPGYDRTEHAPRLLDDEQLASARLLRDKVSPRAPLPPYAESSLQASTPSANLFENARGYFQIGNAYIVVETTDGMVLIDQHAYHERILYWQLEHRLSSQPPEIQKLLVPEPLELTRAASAMLGEHRELFRQFGFELEPFGSGGWACYGVPKYIRTTKVNEFVKSSLDELAASGRAKNPAELRKSMVDMMACKAAIKAGDPLKGADIESLIKEGAKVPHTFACPHGRPTTYKLTFTDIEKIFHRR
ncbi:MAG: DNA mismatch repair endonuclease MutL [Planctomycetaceae bacterium]|nr:DNA mismatch repair endonuclease MutL [Planctomycetaceae bacterium]